MAGIHDKERAQERERLRKLEEKDREVERNRGPRPLEGFSGAHTSWTGYQDDRAAEEVHADDARKSDEASEEQVKRLEAPPKE
jgi:hypothetical protein